MANTPNPDQPLPTPDQLTTASKSIEQPKTIGNRAREMVGKLAWWREQNPPNPDAALQVIATTPLQEPEQPAPDQVAVAQVQEEIATPSVVVTKNEDVPEEVLPFPANETAQIKKELIDPRTISKKLDPGDRNKLASEMRESRKLRDSIKTTETKIDERQQNILVKLKNKLHIPDKQEIELQEQLLEQRTKQDQLPDPKKMIEAYYEKIAETPLTNQEKRDLLKPEALSQLTTEEYIALWRRLNPHVLSHVTRQGFRDHIGMIYHSAGLNEYHDGFTGVLEDGKLLRPPMALQGLKSRDETTVKSFMSDFLQEATSADQAKEMFVHFLNKHLADAPKYPDKTAVHFAGQSVMDGFYGGEKNNEIFFLYPSDVIASQYNFAFNWPDGNFRDPTPVGEHPWNDVFVWPDTLENPGIRIDAGIVFLPEIAPVDPSTGSKYASEIKMLDGKEQKVMIEDRRLTDSFSTWGKEITNESELYKAAQEYRKSNWNNNDLAEYWYSEISKKIEELGFSSDASSSVSHALFTDLCFQPEINEELLNQILPNILENSGANFEAIWKKAENTVSSKEYWENYFALHPELRPKHIIYYKGSPTKAVSEFQQENNIGRANTSKTEGVFLGFEDHHIKDMKHDPRANIGYDELIATADKIIGDHFGT